VSHLIWMAPSQVWYWKNYHHFYGFRFANFSGKNTKRPNSFLIADIAWVTQWRSLVRSITNFGKKRKFFFLIKINVNFFLVWVSFIVKHVWALRCLLYYSSQLKIVPTNEVQFSRPIPYWFWWHETECLRPTCWETLL